MVRRLTNKVALITGGSSGIGRATADLFAKEGAKLAISSRTEDEGRDALREINSITSEAIYIRADASRSTDVQQMIRVVLEEFGRLDILFCNAGIARIIPILEMDEAEWDEVISNNLTSVFLCCKYALPHMIKQKKGSIICSASTYSFVARENFSAYCASKGGILTFAKSVALEMAKFNIRVNCVCPSTTVTPTVEKAWVNSGDPEKARESRVKLHPLGRLATPTDVANAVLYLASDESSFVTGSAFLIDGGYTAQ